jgi:hypothetical protein
MNRYIEIVYDNSASMKGLAGRHTKYEIAYDLFEKEILPHIGLPGDEVMLRLLRKNCGAGQSVPERLSGDKKLMLKRIKDIPYDQNTPLFYTVYDSIEACRNSNADQRLIFILTDGDDTCQVNINDPANKELFKNAIQLCTVLLVQMAVDDPKSSNNLTALTNALGGQTIVLKGSDTTTAMRKKLKSALAVSGFTSNYPLPHCFEQISGSNHTWMEIEATGIGFHQAMLVFQQDLLSWSPDIKLSVSPLQLAELRFLFGLVFRSSLPKKTIHAMLAQLKKPYYYSFDCIYWDFATAHWRYFVPQNPVAQVSNPEAAEADFPHDDSPISRNNDSCYYLPNRFYRIELGITNMPSFRLVPCDIGGHVTALKVGDRVEFRRG